MADTKSSSGRPDEPVPFESFTDRSAKRVKRKGTRAQQAARVANAAKARAVRAERAAERAAAERASDGVSDGVSYGAAVAGAASRGLSMVALARFIAGLLDDPEFQGIVRLIGDVIRRHAETSG